MKKEHCKIRHIPAVLWGAPAAKLILAVHGNMSFKEDIPIEILADTAVRHGYQVLSFDLPEHGDRKEGPELCKVQTCVEELKEVMQYARSGWKEISIFGNSVGAYFSLIAYGQEPVAKAWFLSPVVDMERIIENMMMWFSVPEERLREEGTVPTPIGQTLYWDYYCYVKEHPVKYWQAPTEILYGTGDELCEREFVTGFSRRFSCKLRLVEGAEHFFHTPGQLEALAAWLEETM